MDTNKLIFINYQQFLFYSERKVMILQKTNDLVGCEMQCFFTTWNSPFQEKNLNCQICQDRKLNAGL